MSFLVLAAALELAARTPAVQEMLPRRSYGVQLDHFELKWFLLEEFVQTYGGVDVIVLGNSLVNTGIDPQVVAETYREETGLDTPLRIFNFGVEGMFVEPNAFTAQMLIERYHPAVLILVTEAREYAGGAGTGATERYFNSAWIQYQQGAWSPAGWLFDHSQALQRYLPYRNWMRGDYREQERLYLKHFTNVHPNGYDPDLREQMVFDSPPDPTNSANQETYAFFAEFTPTEERLAALQGLLQLGLETRTVMVVMEMPLHPSNYDFFGQGEDDHAEFIAALAMVVEDSGAYLLATLPEEQIPANGRADRTHLNFQGAPVLSVHLGVEMARVEAIFQALVQAVLAGVR